MSDQILTNSGAISPSQAASLTPQDSTDFILFLNSTPTTVTWQSTVNYIVGQLVNVSGTMYICIAPNLNQSPPNATYWAVTTWTELDVGLFSFVSSGSTPLQPSVTWSNGGPPYTFWTSVIASFTNTGTPTQLQSIGLSSGVPSTFGSAVTAGNLIIVYVQQAGPGTPSSDPTVIDSQGNAYTAYGSYNTASSYTVGTWMFVATSSATGPLTVTMTNSSGVSSPAAGAFEYENLSLLIPTTVSLSATPNPTALTVPILLNSTVTPTSGGPPTGTLQFMDGAFPIGVAQNLVGGSASLAWTYSLIGDVGIHPLTAVYTPTPSSAWGGNTSPTVLENVVQVDTVVSLSALPNPEGLTYPILLDVTVTPDYAFTPEGTIQFMDGSSPISSPQTLVSGSAFLVWVYNEVGDVGIHSLSAVYTPASIEWIGHTSLTVNESITASATFLPGFYLVASYSTVGDALLAPQASFVAVPTLVTPHEPLTLVYTTLNVAYVRITGNNFVDYQVPPTPGSLSGFDTGFISTSGSGLYTLAHGFTATILLTLTAYDSSFVPLGLTPTVTIMVT